MNQTLGMSPTEKDVYDAVGSGITTSRQLQQALPRYSVRQISHALGTLRKRDLVRNGEIRCLACDGRGRARTWQRVAEARAEPGGAS